MPPKVFGGIVVLGLCEIWKILVTISHTIGKGRRT